MKNPNPLLISTRGDKVAISKRNPRTRKAHMYLNESTFGRLDQLQRLYSLVLGKPVSRSLLMRRAVEVLTEHMYDIAGQREIDHELAAIARHRA